MEPTGVIIGEVLTCERSRVVLIGGAEVFPAPGLPVPELSPNTVVIPYALVDERKVGLAFKVMRSLGGL